MEYGRKSKGDPMEVDDTTMGVLKEHVLSDTARKSRMLDQVAQSDAFFKSQQRGEADLSFEEKRRIAKEILENNVPLFLQRYGRYVTQEDLEYFEHFAENYEVNFYLKELHKFFDKKTSAVKVRNRRYEALQELLSNGSYFSESEMKKRNPLLYEQLIGQYMTEEERQAAELLDAQCTTLSSVLMEHMERDETSSLRRRQQDYEDAAFEEGESDSEEEQELCDGESSLPQAEKHMLKNEFANIMYENFLAGRDDFDYSTIDDNVEYDSLLLRQQDEEEKYFDSEQPETLN